MIESGGKSPVTVTTKAPTPAAPPELPSHVPPLPEPAYTEDSNGIRWARLDAQRMSDWCREVALPLPPIVDETEPAVAEAVVAALRDAAINRNAATLGKLGQICESLEGHRSAEEYFRMASQADPRDHRWPYYLGCIAQVTGRTEEAVDRFNAAKSLDPNYPVTYARLAQLYLELDRLDEAAAASQRYTTLQPNDWLGFVGMGRVALSRNDPATALRYLREAVERGPNDFQSHYYLAKTYAALGQADKAREHFDASAKLPRGEWFHHRDPLDVALHRSVDSTAAMDDELESLERSQDWAALAKLSERILERRPRDLNTLCNLASFYRKLARFNEAHAMLDRAAREDPRSAQVFARRAEVLLAQGKSAEALHHVEQAHQHGSPTVATRTVYGRTLYLLGRLPEAETAMREVVALAPDNPGNVFVLGEVLRAQGRTEEAILEYARVLELRPDHPDARKRLGELGQSPPKP